MRDPAHIPQPLRLRIITQNVRYATSSPFPGELPWQERRPALLSQFLYHTRQTPSTLLCIQEVLHDQLQDILAGLNHTSTSIRKVSPGCGEQEQEQPDEWAYIGVGRDDGKIAGEYSPIIYRPSQWEVKHWTSVWLSQTPHVPGSKGWDAASVRILTIAMMQHRPSGQLFLAMNTHLDDQGSTSRMMSARLILNTAYAWAAYWPTGRPDGLFLTGDLNSEANGEAYSVLNAEGSGVVDARRVMMTQDDDMIYGNRDTFTGFNGKGDDVGRTTRIDFVHLGLRMLGHQDSKLLTAEPKPPWKIEGYAVLPNLFDNGIYLSDHRAVVVDLLHE